MTAGEKLVLLGGLGKVVHTYLTGQSNIDILGYIPYVKTSTSKSTKTRHRSGYCSHHLQKSIRNTFFTVTFRFRTLAKIMIQSSGLRRALRRTFLV